MIMHDRLTRTKKLLPIGIVAVIVFACTLAYQASGVAQNTGLKRGDLDRLAWMVGQWEGTLFGAPIQEHWTLAGSGTLVGMCAMGDDSTKATYEFLMIEEKDEVPVMFVRHFGKHSQGREEKALEFGLTRTQAKSAVFECNDKSTSFSKVTYSISKEGELVIALDGERDGKKNHVEGRLKRMKSK